MAPAKNSESLSFDYIVVGGGVAGLVVAARLAEDPSRSVCVLEAGQDVAHNTDVQTPGLFFRNIGKSDLDWRFFTTPQKGVNSRAIYLPRGKGLGGSSILNLMQLGRAPAQEYDAFEALGSKGWNWQELLKYFKKSETFTSTSEISEKFCMKMDPSAHGTSGPLPKSLPRWTTDLHHPIVQALESLGNKYNSDSSNGDNRGVWTGTTAIDYNNFTRGSSASAYYEPNKSKPNLTVVTGAYVTRVLFKPTKGFGDAIAEAVEYMKDGQMNTVYAEKEVILSAGSFKTPHLLELSGIGNQNLLQSHEIPVVVDLPGVGTNLRTTATIFQDHLWCPFMTELDSKYESRDVLNDPARAAEELKRYESTKDGMLSATPMSAFAFLPLGSFSEKDKVVHASRNLNLDHLTDLSRGTLNTFQCQKEWLESEQFPDLEIASIASFVQNTKATAPQAGKNYFSFLLGLLHPFSRGTVHMSSPDPLASPAIDPRFLDNGVDLEILIQAIKYARKLISTKFLCSAITREVAPGPEVQSDDEIAEYIKNNLQTVYHPVGSAAMLPREDGGVVDENLRVYGTENLRVIDASIIPIQISAHIQATVYAIAEKGADLIKSTTYI